MRTEKKPSVGLVGLGYRGKNILRNLHELVPTLVKKGATIGANSTIVCGVTLRFTGDGAECAYCSKRYALEEGAPVTVKEER